MKTAKFGTTYTSYSTVTIQIPDNIDTTGPNAKENVLNYLQNNINHIPLPDNAEYVSASAEIDNVSEISINGIALNDE